MMDEKCGYKTPTPADSLEQQIIDPSFPKNEREWWAAEEITRLRAEVEALKAEDARQRKLWQKENDELVQILGKALQYPRFVDDQSVFPGATEADGVCVPCHTALSIADEAAEKIEALKAELARLTPMMRLEPTGWEFLDWIEPDFLTSIPQGTQLYMIDAARAAQGERG